jgi:SpoVK/Ycf46/Vps4 family AAA+-type ATPase
MEKNMSYQDDNSELNDILEDEVWTTAESREPLAACEDEAEDEGKFVGRLVQWTSGDGKRFFAAGKTIRYLPPAVYELDSCESGIFFEKIDVKTEGLIRFPQTNSERVIREIETFWDKEDRFREYKLSYKRGIILWGPPGSGKSCTIQLIIKDVVERGGIVVKFGHPALFLKAMRNLRDIQRDTPVVVLMEDIDSTLQYYSESNVLNILDGVDEVDKCVFLATTNYPERLGARILNRPSRFDKRFKIGHPNSQSRVLYFEHIFNGRDKAKELGVDIEQWAEDTKGFSIAHLKELFVAVCILGDNYNEALETLSSMKEEILAEKEFERPDTDFGFGAVKKKKIRKIRPDDPPGW